LTFLGTEVKAKIRKRCKTSFIYEHMPRRDVFVLEGGDGFAIKLVADYGIYSHLSDKVGLNS
jgi:hypothetical protein